ncbi:hypothetical protein G9A89_002665 [Geosiphon pyriformis]|nr:hypothetical protein G9A89_002665 [Geosiphon pyriformis]
MASQRLLHDLSHNFGSILNNQIASDVRIVVGDGSNPRTFHVHSLILAARSSYFAVALSNYWVKRENNIIIFSKPNISPQIFEVIIRYIYLGEISLNKYGIPIILGLLIAADELLLENLINHLEDYLIEHYAKELKENFASLHETSFMHNSFKKLQEFCTQIAAKSPTIIFRSQDFTSLNKNFLSSILSRDDLMMEEIEIWKKIVGWAAAKLDNNIKVEEIVNWTDENYDTFKESIEELLPLIRFFHISSVDFYHKVKPFARILPGNLYKDLLHHYLVPGSHQMSVETQPFRSIGSKLLQLHNVKQLDHWIQGKDENTPFQNQLEYNFNLLLRGSPDGFNPADFHRLCDDKGATVSVIKVKGTGQLIGVYTQASWRSYNNYLYGKGSFIFSLGDGKAENSKFVSGKRTYASLRYRPESGQYSFVVRSDVCQNSPGCFCRKDSSYEHAIMLDSENQSVDFFVEEYEVFQIENLN